MPTQRKPTPRKAAYKATELPSTRFETDRRIPLIILAVIAALMLLVLLFSRCSAPTQHDDMPAPGEPAVIEESSEDAETQEIEEPINPSAKASLAEYTWDELSEISEKIAATSSESDAIYVAKQYRLVGMDGKLDPSATKTVEFLDGTTAPVRIIGFNHDTPSSGSGRAGITFMFADGIGSMAYNEDGSNYGGWPASSISYYLGVELWQNLPDDLENRIVEVNKNTVIDSEGTLSQTGDVIWLPSYIELMGQVDAEFQDDASLLQQEGSQYQLFADAGVSAASNNSALVMHSSSQASAWWLRTGDFSGDTSWYYVNAAGHPTDGGPASSDYVLAPCFCV